MPKRRTSLPMPLDAYQQRVFDRNLGWAISIALSMRSGLPTGVYLGDIIQEARIGLWDALAKFDPALGPFRKYAEERIRGCIRDYIRDNTRGSRTVGTFIKKRDLVRAEFEALNRRQPTLEEIAGQMKLDPKKYTEMEVWCMRLISKRYRMSRSKTYDAEWWVNEQDLKRAVLYSLRKLNQNQLKTLYLIFIRELTEIEIAGARSITEGRVSQIRSRALEKIRKTMSELGYYIKG